MPLHHVDPNKKRGLWYGATVRFARSGLGKAYALNVASRIDPWLYHATAGRYPKVLGGMVSAPLLMTGAKSGRPRVVQLVYFHDGPDPILVASKGGEPTNPDWYHNLKAHPECEFGGEKYLATEVTKAAEYERLFRLAKQVYPGYGDYRLKLAAAGGRQIPIFRLTSR